ncbi:MAG TPA: MmgE/PrpD family protein [Thermodesulfobacteriota bacterium]
MSLTAEFARLLLTIADRGLTDAERATCRDLVVDGVAIAAAGSLEKGPRLLAAQAAAAGGAPVATVIGHGFRTDPVAAARTNGAAMHVLDWEPMWNPPNHAVSTTLPAILALGEALSRGVEVPGPAARPAPGGERLLLALAVGIEAQARLRLASGQYEPAQLTFHPPGVVGPLGAAAASAVLLGLGADELAHALGIAASRAGAVLVNVGSMTKGLHCGDAAASGLDAALLAGRGFTADPDALAGRRGFGYAFFGEAFDPSRLVAPVETLHVVDPGPAFKVFPSQYGTHFAIAAALDLHPALPPGARIERVRITTPVMPYVDRPRPATGLAGKFSFQYAAAVALLDGRVGIESFTDARRFAPDMERLLARTELVQDPAIEGRFDRMHVRIQVTLDDGRSLERRCDGPPGIWGRPIERRLLADKARGCLGLLLGPAEASRTLETLERVDTLPAGAIAELLGGLGRDGVDRPWHEAAGGAAAGGR